MIFGKWQFIMLIDVDVPNTTLSYALAGL